VNLAISGQFMFVSKLMKAPYGAFWVPPPFWIRSNTFTLSATSVIPAS